MTSPNVNQPAAVLDSAAAPPRRSRFRRALPPTLSRPTSVGVVAAMLYASAALAGVGGFVMMIVSGATSGTEGNMLFVFGVVYLVVAALEIYMARGVLDGEPGARLMAILLSLVAIAFVALRIQDATGTTLVVMGVALVFYVVTLGGLLTPGAGAYFKS